MSATRKTRAASTMPSWRVVLFGLAVMVLSACGAGSQAVDADDLDTDDRGSIPAEDTSDDAQTDPEGDPPPDADATVVLYNFHIDGPEAVPAGSQILVTNVGTPPHDWVDEDGTFGTERFGQDEWELVTVDTPGTYTVLCTLHPTNMRAILEVTDGPVPDELAEPDEGTTIELTEYAFVGPAEFPAGTEVTVTNIGRLDHDLSSGDGTFATAELVPDASEAITLDTPGTYDLVCTLHPNDMRRTVTVTG